MQIDAGKTFFVPRINPVTLDLVLENSGIECGGFPLSLPCSSSFKLCQWTDLSVVLHMLWCVNFGRYQLINTYFAICRKRPEFMQIIKVGKIYKICILHNATFIPSTLWSEDTIWSVVCEKYRSHISSAACREVRCYCSITADTKQLISCKGFSELVYFFMIRKSKVSCSPARLSGRNSTAVPAVL